MNDLCNHSWRRRRGLSKLQQEEIKLGWYPDSRHYIEYERIRCVICAFYPRRTRLTRSMSFKLKHYHSTARYVL